MRQKKIHENQEICEEWWNDFSKFKEWSLNEGYEYNNPNFIYFLQRKNKEEPFCAHNCFYRIKGRSTNENKVIDKEKEKNICDKYLKNNISTRTLAKENNLCQKTIINILKRNNIKSSDREIKVENLQEEIWKKIPNYKNYFVSNKGRIKSSSYKGMGEKLMICSEQDGYLSVNLNRNGKSYTHKVHRLVALCFIPNPNNYPVVNHKNEIRNDNRVENLEWCTQKYNTIYSNGKKVIATNPITKEKIEFLSIQSVKEKGFNPSNVVKCLKGSRMTHGGFTWEYKK